MGKMVVSNEEKLEFDDCVEKFMESSKFLVSDNLCRDIQKLEVATEQLENSIDRDLRLALETAKEVVQNSTLSYYTQHILALGSCLSADQVISRSLFISLLSSSRNHDEMAVVGSALGAVGNIVRWGSLIQIQHLTEDCQLLQCLVKSVLCSEIKTFRMEACQIISNIAARNEMQDEAGLIEPLYKLLEKDELDLDIKMEAAWAIYNIEYKNIESN